ncbi:MAG TPA: response regulator [Planctomycetota bacterium]|nr:response regulator [Planctomycetota bacterium]
MKKLSKASAPSDLTETRCTIHVIEPNAEELIFLCDFLSLSGFKASGSSNPESALEYVARMHPDVLLCPLLGPGISGEEVFVRSRKQSSHTQVLLTSNRILDPLPERIRKASGVELLRGPYNAIALLRAVERLIGRDPEGESGE